MVVLGTYDIYGWAAQLFDQGFATAPDADDPSRQRDWYTRIPADVKKKLHEAIVATLNEPAIKSKLLEQGFEIVANTPEQFGAFQAAEFARWKNLIETRKITAD